MIRLTPKQLCILATMSVFISGCTSSQYSERYEVKSSRFANNEKRSEVENDVESTESSDARPSGLEQLSSLDVMKRRINSQLDLSSKFSNEGSLTVAADNMSLESFIHTVFGDLLKTNYVIVDGVTDASPAVSLQLQKPIGARQLFLTVSQLLADRDVVITERENVFYLHKSDPSKPSNIAFGYGRRPADVPQLAGTISQIVPVLYNKDISVERVLRELTNTRVEEVQGQSAYSIVGDRAEILRALDLLDILDAPAARGKHVALLRLTYVSVDEFVKQTSELLASEGLPIDIGKAGNRNMVLIPLDQIGAVAIFAADALYLDRVEFWAKQLDQPSLNEEKRYFIYHPKYARASDLGQSVGALLGGREANQPDTTRDTASAMSQSNESLAENNSANVNAAKQSPGVSNVSNEDMNMTVDNRSNSLIFYSTGKKYQNLLPMIKRLDVMPKQILLEATIAEVTLTDELNMGVEFALQNGKLGARTTGALGLSEIGGLNLNYTGGVDRIIANLIATDSRANLLSSPSIVVRDGVNATINVGSDIPTVGSTTINPGTETQSTTIQYRKTGVELSITPTISAQGLVVMQIEQKISNAEDGGVAVQGNSAIFERSIKTEVIAQSGQSIMLGGLISDNNTKSKSKVPLLGDLPFVGFLFRSEKDSTRKTELIIVVTPKVLDNPTQWQEISDKLGQQMSLLRITE
jgi:general secretion pathway protein D